MWPGIGHGDKCRLRSNTTGPWWKYCVECRDSRMSIKVLSRVTNREKANNLQSPTISQSWINDKQTSVGVMVRYDGLQPATFWCLLQANTELTGKFEKRNFHRTCGNETSNHYHYSPLRSPPRQSRFQGGRCILGDMRHDNILDPSHEKNGR